MTQNTEGKTLVLLPIEGSPAYDAGLKTGDIISKIDGESCEGLDLTGVSNKIKGEEGTKVTLEIIRDEQTLNVEIERKKVELKYIDSKVLDGNIGYIALLAFDEGCSDKLKEEIQKLKGQNVTSLIIDARDNGGGLVTEAISTSEIFVPNGKTILKSYDKDNKETVSKSKSLVVEKMNVVLLVNENSASATEIFAAAMQDNDIAEIIGTTTYGKGVMQEVQPLSIGGALKITIEEFKTPTGNKINGVGITPDIEVKNEEGSKEDKQLQTAIDYLKNKQ